MCTHSRYTHIHRCNILYMCIGLSMHTLTLHAYALGMVQLCTESAAQLPEYAVLKLDYGTNTTNLDKQSFNEH